MMQPAFMPWQGFFELILKSDRFIFLDDFQFSVQSYHQRNRLFVSRGQVGWYTVPVIKALSFKAPLNRTKINETLPWRQKFWTRIQQNYSKAPHFNRLAADLQAWLSSPASSLADMNISFIKLVSRLMGLETEFVLSSQYPSGLQRSARVAELLRRVGADRYYCARGSFGYMLEDGLFPVNGTEVVFQDFRPEPYPQIGASEGFVPYLSVIDALMNVGPGDTLGLIRAGTERWLTWSEMEGQER